MKELTYLIYQCDLTGHFISWDVPEMVKYRIANGLVHPFMKNVAYFLYHDRESCNFYCVERKEGWK